MEKAKWFNLPKSVTKLTERIEEGGGLEGGGLEGTNYLFVPAEGTDEENAEILLTAYNTAKTMSPSSTNRITVICGNGNYNFSSNFVMDTQYIDLVSLDGNRSIIFNGTGTISITANDVFIKGVDVGSKNFTIGDNLNLLKVENCQGGESSFGGDPTFGSNPINVSGTFTDCVGGNYSFGGYSIASGTFTNCQSYFRGFGSGGIANGTFTNCQGSNYSFGGFGTASGTFTNCIGNDYGLFGAQGTALGIFTNCQGGADSFGGKGTLEGKLYYCRLTDGGFQTVSGAGITRLCIDGLNNENNQG